MCSCSTSDDDANYPQCSEPCVKVIGSGTCGKRCCKNASPEHQAYGSHYCSEHK